MVKTRMWNYVEGIRNVGWESMNRVTYVFWYRTFFIILDYHCVFTLWMCEQNRIILTFKGASLEAKTR